MATVHTDFGLHAHPLVRWLIDAERDLRAAIIAYYNEVGDDFIQVAGPPSNEDLIKRYHDPSKPVELPIIKLKLKRVYNSQLQEPGVEITCQREDLGMIYQWQQQSRSMFRKSKNNPLGLLH